MLCPECMMMTSMRRHRSRRWAWAHWHQRVHVAINRDGMSPLFFFKLRQPQIRFCVVWSKLDFGLVAEKRIPLPNTTTPISLWIPVRNSPTVNYPINLELELEIIILHVTIAWRATSDEWLTQTNLYPGPFSLNHDDRSRGRREWWGRSTLSYLLFPKANLLASTSTARWPWIWKPKLERKSR